MNLNSVEASLAMAYWASNAEVRHLQMDPNPHCQVLFSAAKLSRKPLNPLSRSSTQTQEDIMTK